MKIVSETSGTVCTNIQIIRGPQEDEKNKGSEKFSKKTIVKKFPNLGKEIVNQVYEVQRHLYRINPKRNTLRHVLITLIKTEQRKNIKSSKGKAITNIQAITNIPDSAGQKGMAGYV